MSLLCKLVVRVAVCVNGLVQLLKSHEGVDQFIVGVEERAEPLLVVDVPGDPFQAGLVGILGPAAEQLPALLPHLGIRQLGGAADAQPLQQRLVGKRPLEARAGVLDQAVQQDQSADLAVHVAVFELLANGAGGLRGAGRLDGDDFDEVGDAADVLLVVGLGGERLDGDRDGRSCLGERAEDSLTG
ncbi:hypothetical protein Trco_004833 [Trichoderma cornu-damae]|uniref:Secreted protein n=1 Tax=Trichoderma cornu-damae TaxID=654480 RepID=A0A9P8QHZ5_9HYPO|nr:hypothetical protein Trco_004833 [Trichoderma cornu-damae]